MLDTDLQQSRQPPIFGMCYRSPCAGELARRCELVLGSTAFSGSQVGLSMSDDKGNLQRKRSYTQNTIASESPLTRLRRQADVIHR